MFTSRVTCRCQLSREKIDECTKIAGIKDGRIIKHAADGERQGLEK